MKKLIGSLLTFALASITTLSAINLDELAQVTRDLINNNQLPYSVNLNIDNARASGYASITYNTANNHVSIYVDARQLSYKTKNTWAFVIGHELAHKYIGNKLSGARAEWAADEKGSLWATKSGYNVAAYIEAILQDHNACSKSHGCWHNRAKNLANLHGLKIVGTNAEAHKDHKTSTGAFPSSSPHKHHHDEHEVEHDHDRHPPTPPVPTTPASKIIKVKVPCQHKVQCQHIVLTSCGYVRVHDSHAKHAYDIAYYRVPLNE